MPLSVYPLLCRHHTLLPQLSTLWLLSPGKQTFILKHYANISVTIKMSSFKSSENIQKKEGEPDRCVLDNQSSSVSLNELAMKARKDTVISSFSKEVIHLLTLIEMGSK